ncbi:MAG TPA: DUF4331 family protein [Propionibacteriaceae bacterium]|nr:DUF4331 family protein [Propionibacteriaceae bacterium]
MSHHYSGPDFTCPHDDARLDFCDLFAFPKPEDSSRSILIMDVHPSVTVNPEGPTPTEPFAPGAIYELKIDTDGDAVADIAYRVRFSSSESRLQSATVRRVEGSDAAGTGESGQTVIQDAQVSTGSEAQITEAGDYRFFAGWRSDPFFYDAGGALNDFQFTGDDFFADKDVCSIVLELPNSELGANDVGLWARTLIPADGGGWIQVDRGAHAQQVTFLTPNEGKMEYLAGEPADDARFVDGIAHILEHAGGYSPEEARRVAEPMLPDILPYNPTRPAGYPNNGRLFTDDVGDYVVAILTNGKVTEDNVGPHEDFLSEFPYLGPPHEDRTGA